MNIFDFFTPKADTFYLLDDSTVRQAIEKLDRHKFSVVPMIDAEGRFVTTVSEGDILNYMKNVAHFDLAKAEHATVMSIDKYRPYQELGLHEPFERILELSLEQNFIPLVDDQDAYIGILRRKEIIEFLYKQRLKK